MKCILEDEKNKVVEAKREMEEQRKHAEEEAHRKLDEHEELKREKARLEKKAEEEAKAKVAEEARLKDVEESIEKLHAEVRLELSLSARDHQKRLKEGGATKVDKDENLEIKDEDNVEAEEMPVLPGPPISSYAAVACQEPINNESNVDLPPSPCEMDSLYKTAQLLPLIVVVDEKEVGGKDGIDSEGFTEVATRKSKR